MPCSWPSWEEWGRQEERNKTGCTNPVSNWLRFFPYKVLPNLSCAHKPSRVPCYLPLGWHSKLSLITPLFLWYSQMDDCSFPNMPSESHCCRTGPLWCHLSLWHPIHLFGLISKTVSCLRPFWFLQLNKISFSPLTPRDELFHLYPLILP